MEYNEVFATAETARGHEVSSAERPRRTVLARFFGALGPGPIAGAADDDPSGIATYSAAGALLGTAQLWTALITWPLIAAVQMMCARIAMATGSGLAGALRQKLPKSVVVLAALALFLANTTAANQHAFEENLRVLQQEVAFKRITAPFPGVITNRRTNVDDLIVANNVNNEIFHIQQSILYVFTSGSHKATPLMLKLASLLMLSFQRQ